MGHRVTDTPDRRVQSRVRVGPDAPALAARLRTGTPLRVLDTSPDGMLVESPARLLPGRHVDVVLQREASQDHAPWLVIHSRVGCIRGSSDLRYRAGLRRTAGSTYPRRGSAASHGKSLPGGEPTESASVLEGARNIPTGVPGTGIGRGDPV
jgi:hypothetical protein